MTEAVSIIMSSVPAPWIAAGLRFGKKKPQVQSPSAAALHAPGAASWALPNASPGKHDPCRDPLSGDNITRYCYDFPAGRNKSG